MSKYFYRNSFRRGAARLFSTSSSFSQPSPLSVLTEQLLFNRACLRRQEHPKPCSFFTSGFGSGLTVVQSGICLANCCSSVSFSWTWPKLEATLEAASLFDFDLKHVRPSKYEALSACTEPQHWWHSGNHRALAWLVVSHHRHERARRGQADC